MRTFFILNALSHSFMSSPSYADTGGSCHFHGSKPAAEATVQRCTDAQRDPLMKGGK
jgi:hypothetical protein